MPATYLVFLYVANKCRRDTDFDREVQMMQLEVGNGEEGAYRPKRERWIIRSLPKTHSG